MKRSNSLAGLFFGGLMVFILPLSVQAQSLVRQSIGTIGGSNQVGNVTIQSTVAQPYFTATSSINNTALRPGFAQPVMIVVAQPLFTIDVNIYPNPGSGSVTISTDVVESPLTVQVRDIHGKVIYEETESQSGHIVMDCSTWAQGTYFVAVHTKGSKVQTSKLIIVN